MKKIVTITTMSLIPALAIAYTINLSWTNPTQRIDGTALAPSEIKETLISCGRPGGPYTEFTWVSPGAATTAAPPTQFTGKTCCVAQTRDTLDQLSDFSNEACKTPARPKPPTGFGIT